MLRARSCYQSVIKERDLGNILKLDILVNDLIIVELKAVDILLLINFNSENITGKGLTPLVNEYFAALPE